jgi:formylglycine-generating enzyme required for sulfatase activity
MSRFMKGEGRVRAWAPVGGAARSTPVTCSAAVWLALLAALCLTLLPPPAQAQAPAAERRVALVVGNADYVRAPLVNPVNDAADLAAALRRLGFEVLERRNRGSEELKRDLIEFQDKLGPGAVGLFYFAGHGMQAGRGGRNYLLPVGVDYRRERDVEVFGLDAGSVLARMEESGASLSIVILDACRDSPLPPEGRTSASRGLGRMEAPSGSLVAFATAPGSTADENRGGRNGLYTQYLLRAIEVPGLRLEDVFQQVRRDVERASSRRQSPEEISKLTSAFYFRPAQQVVALAPPVVAPAPSVVGGGVSLADLERLEQARRSWAQWQQRMQADFDRITGFQGGADLRAQAWQRFLETWKDDNPTADDDERLRAQARQALGQAQAEAQRQQRIAAAPMPAAAGGSNSGAVGGALQVFKDCAECPEMAVIPAGRFLMGSPASEAGRSANEGPQRWVDVPRFALGRFEVTQRQWEAVMGSNPSSFRACGPDCPVENVSWNDAQEFVRRLSQRTGQNYRLPSEAEWEYAARAGSATAYPWGERASRDHANYGADICCSGRAEGRDRWVETAPVGQFPANAFGLHDMHGNLWEWVQDVWHDNYAGAPSDGSAWMSGGDPARRVLRGGSWSIAPQFLRSAYRNRNAPDGRNFITGFRIARTF